MTGLQPIEARPDPGDLLARDYDAEDVSGEASLVLIMALCREPVQQLTLFCWSGELEHRHSHRSHYGYLVSRP